MRNNVLILLIICLLIICLLIICFFDAATVRTEQKSDVSQFSEKEKVIFCAYAHPFLKDLLWFAKCPRNSVAQKTVFIQDVYGRNIGVNNGFQFTISCQYSGITRVDFQRKKCKSQSIQEEECVEVAIVEQRLDFATKQTPNILGLVSTWEPKMVAVFTIKDFEQLLLDCARCKKLDSDNVVSYVPGSSILR